MTPALMPAVAPAVAPVLLPAVAPAAVPISVAAGVVPAPLPAGVVCALLAAAAGALLVTSTQDVRLRRLTDRHGRGSLSADRVRRATAAVLHRPRMLALIAAVAVVPVAGPVGAAVAGVGAALLARALVRRRNSALRAEQLAAATRLVAGFAAELRAGRPALDALAAVARVAPTGLAEQLGGAVRAARLGADPAEALERHAGDLPGVARLAAGWRVSGQTGAGLADVVDALAGDLRATARRDRAIAVELAAPRATARLLAGLPLVGIALGTSLGAHPVRFLLHSVAGAAVLAAGLAFEGAGLAWTERLVRRAERAP